MEVQSVLFSKNAWTIPRAKAWLISNGYTARKVDTTENYHRFRQKDPRAFSRATFRMTEFSDNIKAVVGMPRK